MFHRDIHPRPKHCRGEINNNLRVIDGNLITSLIKVAWKKYKLPNLNVGWCVVVADNPTFCCFNNTSFLNSLA
jgi:hypothetical protein